MDKVNFSNINIVSLILYFTPVTIMVNLLTKNFIFQKLIKKNEYQEIK